MISLFRHLFVQHLLHETAIIIMDKATFNICTRFNAYLMNFPGLQYMRCARFTCIFILSNGIRTNSHEITSNGKIFANGCGFMLFLTIFIFRTKLLRWKKHGCYQHVTFYDYKADSRGFFLFLKSFFDASIKKGMTNIRIKVQSSC